MRLPERNKPASIEINGLNYVRAIDAVEKGRDLGERLRLDGIVSQALITMGGAQCSLGQDGMSSIEQALRIALNTDLPEEAGRCYSNLQSIGSSLNRFAEAERYYTEGIAYCKQRELGVYTACLTGGRAYVLLLVGPGTRQQSSVPRCLTSPFPR